MQGSSQSPGARSRLFRQLLCSKQGSTDESDLSQARISFRNALPLVAGHFAPGIDVAFVIQKRFSILVRMLCVERADDDGGIAEAGDLKIAQFDRLVLALLRIVEDLRFVHQASVR